LPVTPRRVTAFAGRRVLEVIGERPFPEWAAARPELRHRRLGVGQRQSDARSHRRKADPQVEPPYSRHPRSAVDDPDQTSAGL